jgi:hypothetical protein
MGRWGGGVVGHVVLHDRSDDEDIEKWLNPLSVATCDSCKHIFMTRENMLYVIDLNRPLKDMADNHGFLLLSSASLAIASRPLWPSGWPAKHSNNGGLQLVSVAPDGSSAYVGHALASIFLFNPMNPAAEDASARWVIATGDAGIGAGVSGLHHTSSLWNLVVTREKTVHIVKISDGRGGNPLKSGHPEAYKLSSTTTAITSTATTIPLR